MSKRHLFETSARVALAIPSSLRRIHGGLLAAVELHRHLEQHPWLTLAVAVAYLAWVLSR